MFNQRSFHRRLQIIIQQHFNGNQKEFNAVIDQRDAVTKWRDAKPSLDAILTISEKFNVSANWLLFGIGPQRLETRDTYRVEDSLLRLARLLGIEDSFRWIDKISKILKIPAHRFTDCISANIIPEELLSEIASRGYPAEKWLQGDTTDHESRFANLSERAAGRTAKSSAGRG